MTKNKTLKLFLGAILPLALLAVWECSAVYLGNPSILPRVGEVISRLVHPFDDVLGTGSLFYSLLVSLLRVALGFFIAAFVAVPLGLVMGMSDFARRFVGPFVEILRPLCPIAWLPFAMTVFKTYTVVNIWGVSYSDTILDNVQLGMLFILFWGGFFPILLNTIDGVLGCRKSYIESALTLGANTRQIFFKVVLPASLPFILSGLRIGLGICWMVIIAAEMLPGSDCGIGYLIMYAYELAEMDVLICGMIVIGLIGAALSFILTLVSNKVSFWQGKEI